MLRFAYNQYNSINGETTHQIKASDLDNIIYNFFGSSLKLEHQNIYCTISNNIVLYHYDKEKEIYTYDDSYDHGHGANYTTATNVFYIEDINLNNNKYVIKTKNIYSYCDGVCMLPSYYSTYNDYVNKVNAVFEIDISSGKPKYPTLTGKEPDEEDLKAISDKIPTTTYTFIKENGNFILETVEIDKLDNNNEVSFQPIGQLKVSVYQINIRKEANTTSEDIGDVHLNEIYDVYDIVNTDTYTWYKIKKDKVVGWVSNKKNENWLKYYEKTEKILYFYKKNGNLITASDYDEDCIGQYKCTYECNNDILFSTYGSKYDLDYNTVVITDGHQSFLYNYKTEQKILDLSIYEQLYFWKGYILAKKDKKAQIITFEGKKSKFYEDVADYFTIPDSTPWEPLQNISTKKQLVSYKKGNKHGLLSLNTLTEITDAVYDYISIYDDNIVVKINNLEYVMDESGNIISKGYKNVMWSNDKIIIISENELLDIIDYEGNSKIKEKINTNSYTYLYNRKNVYGSVMIYSNFISITTSNEEIIISIPIVENISEYINEYINQYGKYPSKVLNKYHYNLKTETLTIEE